VQAWAGAADVELRLASGDGPAAAVQAVGTGIADPRARLDSLANPMELPTESLYYGAGAAAPLARARDAEALFAQLDVNGDGVISRDEFIAAYGKVPGAPPPAGGRYRAPAAQPGAPAGGWQRPVFEPATPPPAAAPPLAAWEPPRAVTEGWAGRAALEPAAAFGDQAGRGAAASPERVNRPPPIQLGLDAEGKMHRVDPKFAS
jgi:hypothetical protein